MEGYIDENRWIDLSGLPRMKHGAINWKDSVGCNLPFQFDKAEGVIAIQQYESKNEAPYLLINIDKYLPEPKKIRADQLKKCQLFQLVANRIADCKPEWIPYLANPNDAYYFSIQSNEPIRIKCPICGHEDTVIVGNWFYQGKNALYVATELVFQKRL